MSKRDQHSARVDAWMAENARGSSREELLELVERAVDALWRRAHYCLGGITLVAIVDRVLVHGTERFPFLSALRVEPTGVRFDGLAESAQRPPPEVLEQALRFLVVELLTVLGTLTGEILTPALGAELAKVSRAPSRRTGGEP
ncbi:MAG TPA: hypothetical protein VK447_08030 [Myxococcaceae bacterium]|nr:hypothetical protein [Myxococcaceae bacterium]